MRSGRKFSVFRWCFYWNFLVAHFCHDLVAGQTIADTERVLTDKFDPTVYNKVVRGQIDLSVPMPITIDLGLKSIVKVDEIQESIQLLAVVFVSWKDERLVWNISDYNGTKEVFMPVEMVWHPAMYVHQPISGEIRIGDTSRQLTQHSYDGMVRWTFVDTLTIPCSFDLTSFPWDLQTCDILFILWGYMKEHVQISAKQDSITLDFYEENSGWSIISTKTFPSSHPFKSRMAYQFVLQRRPDFFVMTIFLPVLLLSVLSIFVFMIPIESGERISFSLTIILSIVLFITLVSSFVPQSSESIPAMCFFLLFECIQSVTACVCNIISIHCYYKDIKKGRPGKILKKIYSFCCTNRSKGKAVLPMQYDDQVKHIDVKEKEGVDDEQNEPIKIPLNWTDVSRMLDLFFAIIMILFSLFCYSIFGYYLTQGE